MRFDKEFIQENIVRKIDSEIEKFVFNGFLSNDYFFCNIFTSNIEVSDYVNKYLSPYFVLNKQKGKGDVDLFVIRNTEPKDFDFSGCTEIDILKHKNKEKEIKAYFFAYDNYKVYYIVRSKNIIYLDLEKKRIVIIGSRNEELLRDLVLVIRDSSYIRLVSEGFVQVHASSVVKNNKAVLFIGKSNSGKTTSLLHTLKDEHCDLLSNGRVFAKNTGKGIIIIGTPENIGIRKRTIQEFEEFLEWSVSEREEIKLGYKELCNRFHCNITKEGNLEEIVVTNFGGNINLLSNRNLIEETINNEVIDYQEIQRREWIAFCKVDSEKYNNNAKELRKILLCCKNIRMTYLDNQIYKIVNIKKN